MSDEKKEKKSKKPYFILGGIGLFVILLIVANVDTARKEKEAANANSQPSTSVSDTTSGSSNTPVETQPQLSESELLQQALVEAFGEAPAGYRWNEKGDLVPVSDESLTAEEVCWRYLQALSNKDFMTAQKYAQTSQCIATYDYYYSDEIHSSSSNELAKRVYSAALGSIEILEAQQNGVFADGRFVYTFKANIIDLSNKTFWMDDKEEVFSTIREYSSTESDKRKTTEYVYSLIYEYYESGNATKKEVTFDLIVDKVTKGGYLIANDTDLNNICSYKDGTTVYEYLMAEYADWINQKIKEEREQAEQSQKQTEQETQEGSVE